MRGLLPRLTLACALAAWIGAPSAAHAQTPFRIDLQRLHPSAMPESGLALAGGPGLPVWTLSFAASMHYGRTLLTAVEPGGMEQAVLLEDQLVLEPALAIGLPAGLSLQIAWPFVVSAHDTPEARPLTRSTLDGTGIGDPRLVLGWRLAAGGDVIVLVEAGASIPTLGDGEGAAAQLGAEHGVSVLGTAGVEGRVGAIVLRANVGARIRTEDASFAVGGGRLTVGSELTWGAGVELRPLRAVHVLGEIAGSNALDAFGDAQRTPVELLVAVRTHPHDDVELVPLAGLGLTEGYGTPAWRVGLTARAYFHMHDEDADGVGDAHDRCPAENEDLDGWQDDDGCPDPDDDGDGILDAVDRCARVAGLGRFDGCPDPDADHDSVGDDDRCANEAEDEDGFEDGDGCPEADNDDDGMADGADRCPNDAEDRDGYEDDDGCPEADNDRDGVADAGDRCPREAEDQDGFEDEDGCADVDNDGDAVPDVEDGPPDPGGVFGVCRNLRETDGGRDAAEPDGCPDSAVRVDVAARRVVFVIADIASDEEASVH
jgi:hypothetical protein